MQKILSVHKFQNFHESRKFFTLLLTAHPVPDQTNPNIPFLQIHFKLSSVIYRDNKRGLLVHASQSKFCMQSYRSRACYMPHQYKSFKNLHLKGLSARTFTDSRLQDGQSLCVVLSCILR